MAVTELPQTGLDHLTAVLEEAGYDAQRLAPDEVVTVLPVKHADSLTITYRLIVTGSGSGLVVAEEPESCLLPRFCPERHIVGRGQFCMYWERERRFDVIDRASARQWLGVLLEFLRAQRRAAYLRRWPSEEAWAHGETAANAQRQAEKIGTALQGLWPEWITGRRLEARREADGTYRVFLDGHCIYSAWVAPNRRTKGGTRFVGACEMTSKGRRLCKKQNRARMLVELAFALWKWGHAEAFFWKVFSDLACCGTMDTCALKIAFRRGCNG